MGRIENLFDKYKDVGFKPMHHCPKGFYATLSDSEYRTIIFYNADLSEDILYTTLLHEIEHYRNGDSTYSEKNEYKAEVNSAIAYINESQLKSYIYQHPEAEDFEIADNFNLTISEFKKCIEAYSVKGIYFNDNHRNIVDNTIFYKTYFQK